MTENLPFQIDYERANECSRQYRTWKCFPPQMINIPISQNARHLLDPTRNWYRKGKVLFCRILFVHFSMFRMEKYKLSHLSSQVCPFRGERERESLSEVQSFTIVGEQSGNSMIRLEHGIILSTTRYSWWTEEKQISIDCTKFHNLFANNSIIMMQTRGFAHDFVFLFKRFYFPVSRPFYCRCLGSDRVRNLLHKYEYCARKIFKDCLHSGSLLNDPFLVFPSTLKWMDLVMIKMLAFGFGAGSD